MAKALSVDLRQRVIRRDDAPFRRNAEADNARFGSSGGIKRTVFLRPIARFRIVASTA